MLHEPGQLRVEQGWEGCACINFSALEIGFTNYHFPSKITAFSCFGRTDKLAKYSEWHSNIECRLISFSQCRGQGINSRLLAWLDGFLSLVRVVLNQASRDIVALWSTFSSVKYHEHNNQSESRICAGGFQEQLVRIIPFLHSRKLKSNGQ